LWPSRWSGTTRPKAPPPRVLVEARRAAGIRRGPAAAAPRRPHSGRLTETGDPTYPYRAQVLRRLDPGTRVLGVLRAGPGDSLRVVPTDKKARSDYELSPSDAGGAEPGELVAVELAGDARRGTARAKVTERFGSVSDQRNIALIAIHQHGIPDRVSPRGDRRGRARQAGPGQGPRSISPMCRSSPSIRPMPAIMTMRCGPPPTTTRPTPAASR
jgi:ribonuclease R